MTKKTEQSKEYTKEELIEQAQKLYEQWESDYPHMTEKRMLYDLSQALAFQQNLLTEMFNRIEKLNHEIIQSRQTKVQA